MVSIFMNDIKIMGLKNIRVIRKVKAELIVAFDIVDMGLISFYLGLNINKNHKNQKKSSHN